MSEYSLRYRPDLQGLRAIAVLLVILAHARLPHFAGGYIGVDVFFVLSGYLITSILLRELEIHGRINFLSFYARRFKRLYPALLLMLGFTACYVIVRLSKAEASSQLSSFPFAATWTSNFYFAFTTFDYFDELANRDLYLHTWSLGVEEQFYLVWPGLLFLLYFLGKQVPQVQNRKHFMLSGLIIASIASFVLSIYWIEKLPHEAFYLMPSRIWQFSLGAIIGFLLYDRTSTNRRIFSEKKKAHIYLIFVVGITLIIGSGLFLHPNLAYPGFWALLPSIGTALVILSGSRRGSSKILAHPIFVWIGDRSYSLYLWHWPIFMIGFSTGYEGQLVPTIFMILLAVLAAILSFRLVEFPFWKGKWSAIRPARIVLTSLLIMAGAVLVANNMLHDQPEVVPETDISSSWRGDAPIIYRLGCDAWYTNSDVVPCAFGEQSAQKNVVLFGDSIGAQWFSMVYGIFSPPEWRTIVYTKSSCAIIDEDYYYARIGKVYQVCREWRDEILKELERRQPDVLFIGSASTYDFTKNQWIEGTSRILERFRNTKTSVFIIPGTPTLGFDGPGCVSRNLSSDGRIGEDACMAKNRLDNVDAVSKYLRESAEGFSNVDVLYLNDIVCPDKTCNAINNNGMVVFRDSQHLTDSYVRAQIPTISERIEPLLGANDVFNTSEHELK